MINFDQEEFEKLKTKVHSDYKKIGNIYCPALKSKIVFNANGLYHLHYNSDRSERNKLVQRNKFSFFQSATEILRILTTIQEYRRCIVKNNSETVLKLNITEWFSFWAITSFKKQIRIKIIVRRVGGENGQYHFWSVMPYWSLRHKERMIGDLDLEHE